MLKIAVLVSGGGTNLQAIIDAKASGIIKSGQIDIVISSKEGAFALERANKAGISTLVIPRKDYDDSLLYSNEILKILKERNIDLVVLAGFMTVIKGDLLKEYADKIINVHPSLIPSFCGDGFYGLRVHKAALDYGVKITGATVHFVNEITDGGKIIMQKAVDIFDDDTPEVLQERVMKQAEHVILPQAIEKICSERLIQN